MFNDENLNKSYESNLSEFEKRKDKLDKISSDIRRLNEFLKKFPVVKGVFIITDDRLLTTQAKIYFLNKIYLSCDGVCKPLIEHKASVREIIYEYLPEFLKFLSGKKND
jgi:F0F1-type ATP synthase delta subunit